MTIERVFESWTIFSEVHDKARIQTCSNLSTAWSKIGLCIAGKLLGDIRPKTAEAQWGVNAFFYGFSLLLLCILVAVMNNICIYSSRYNSTFWWDTTAKILHQNFNSDQEITVWQ